MHMLRVYGDSHNQQRLDGGIAVNVCDRIIFPFLEFGWEQEICLFLAPLVEVNP